MQTGIGEWPGLATSYLSGIENGEILPAVWRGIPRGFIRRFGAKLSSYGTSCFVDGTQSIVGLFSDKRNRPN